MLSLLGGKMNRLSSVNSVDIMHPRAAVAGFESELPNWNASQLVQQFRIAFEHPQKRYLDKIANRLPSILDEVTAAQLVEIYSIAFSSKFFHICRDIVSNDKLDATAALASMYCYDFSHGFPFQTGGLYIDLLIKGASLTPDERLPDLLACIDKHFITTETLNSEVIRRIFSHNRNNQLLLEMFYLRDLYKGVSRGEELSVLDVDTFARFPFLCERGVITARCCSLMEDIYDRWEAGLNIDHTILLDQIAKYPEYITNLFVIDNYGTNELKFMLRQLKPDMLKLFHSSIVQSDVAQHLGPLVFGRLKKIMFLDGGQAHDSWSTLSANLLKLLPEVTYQKKAYLQYPRKDHPIATDIPHLLVKLNMTGCQFLRIQGRTILLSSKNQDIIALKIQKQNESPEALEKEFHTLHAFLNAKIRLRSYLPEPLELIHIRDVASFLKNFLPSAQLQQFQELVGEFQTTSESPLLSYVYRVDKEHLDYFTYVQDTVSDEQFAASNRKTISDLARLYSQQIIYPQLADLFHNLVKKEERWDKGRYQVLANLISEYALVEKKGSAVLDGTGMLAHWKQPFPNVRGTGLADWGDWASLSEWLSHSKTIRDYYVPAHITYQAKTGNYLVVNILAEYLYVLFLLNGSRASALDKQADGVNSKKVIWQNAAQQAIQNSAQLVHQFTSISEKQAKNLLMAVVDIYRLARQMQFWMTEEYIPYIKMSKLPTDIYGDKTNVQVYFDLMRDDTFTDEIGFTADGKHAALGPMNGPEPIKENNKLLYTTINIILVMFLQNYKTRQALQVVKQEPDPIAAKKLLQNSFRHLPPREYHGLMFAYKRKQLLTEKYDTAAKGQLVSEIVSHKRDYAAATLQRLWRNHVSETRDSEEDLSSQSPQP